MGLPFEGLGGVLRGKGSCPLVSVVPNSLALEKGKFAWRRVFIFD